MYVTNARSLYINSNCDPVNIPECKIDTTNCASAICNDLGFCAACKVGYYGVDCKGLCPGCEAGCSQANGFCDTCIPGYYGDKCHRKCFHCLEGACHKVSGVCEKGCPLGRYGENCETVCPCVKGIACDATTGECESTPGDPGTEGWGREKKIKIYR